MPIGKVWIYRLLFVCTIADSPPMIKLAASPFARRFIGVQGRDYKFLRTLLPQKPQIGRIGQRAGHAHRDVNIFTVLQAIKGEGRQACYRTFVDLRRLPDRCSAYGKLFRRRHNASCDCCRFRTSLQEISRIGPLHRRCRAVASLPTLTTTSSFYRRDSAPPGR